MLYRQVRLDAGAARGGRSDARGEEARGTDRTRGDAGSDRMRCGDYPKTLPGEKKKKYNAPIEFPSRHIKYYILVYYSTILYYILLHYHWQTILFYIQYDRDLHAHDHYENVRIKISALSKNFSHGIIENGSMTTTCVKKFSFLHTFLLYFHSKNFKLGGKSNKILSWRKVSLFASISNHVHNFSCCNWLASTPISTDRIKNKKNDRKSRNERINWTSSSSLRYATQYYTVYFNQSFDHSNHCLF